MMRMAIETLYDYVVQNIGFCGQETGLPFEVSRRIFELVIFESYGDDSLSRALVYMLMIMEDRVLEMNCGDRFRYIGHGKFITDCFMDPNSFRRLRDMLRDDLKNVMEDENRLSMVVGGDDNSNNNPIMESYDVSFQNVDQD